MKLGSTMMLKEYVHIIKKQHAANPIVKPEKAAKEEKKEEAQA